MALQYEGYYGGLEQISMIQDVIGATNGSIFLYKNAYGNGIDLQYSYYNELLKENLIISQSSDLPSPPQYMIDQGNITLNLDFVLETDSNHIVIEGVEWDKSTTKETSNEVYIKNESGDILYYLPVPYAYDSYGSSQLLKYQFKLDEEKDSLYITIKTPYSWLNDFSRGYPVYIDPSTGYRSPGTVVDDPAVGAVIWSAPDQAKASDNTYAASAGGRYGAISHYLKSTNFGFSVPTGATVDGIIVQIEKKGNNPNVISDNRVRIVKGYVIKSTDKSAAGYWPTTDTYYTYGSSSDKWGETWTPSDINANGFGVVLSATMSPAAVATVDHVRITVYYTEPGPSNFYINVGDTWQDAEQIYINVGDVWQDVEAVYVNVGDSWQVIFSI